MNITEHKAVIELAERLVRPEIKRIMALSDNASVQQMENETIHLTMALAFGLAVLAKSMYTAAPKTFGEHIGGYVTQIMNNLEEVTDDTTTEEISAWGRSN